MPKTPAQIINAYLRSGGKSRPKKNPAPKKKRKSTDADEPWTLPRFDVGVQSIDEGFCAPIENPDLPSYYTDSKKGAYAKAIKEAAGGKMNGKVAAAIADAFPTGAGLANATEPQLMHLGATKKQAHRLVVAAGFQPMLRRREVAGRPRQHFRRPSDLVKYIHGMIGDRQEENFAVILLDSRQRPIDVLLISRGGLAAVDVHPREVFRDAIRLRAHSIILTHNHPSGNAEPSEADVDLTNRLTEIGRLVGIPVLDHIVVAHGGTTGVKSTSLAALGLL